jgi:hypothetical protein
MTAPRDDDRSGDHRGEWGAQRAATITARGGDHRAEWDAHRARVTTTAAAVTARDRAVTARRGS